MAAALCATVIGVPLGLWLQSVLGDAITSSIGVGPGTSSVPPLGATVATIAALMVISVGAVTSASVRTSRVGGPPQRPA